MNLEVFVYVTILYWVLPINTGAKFQGFVALLSALGVIVFAFSFLTSFLDAERRWKKDNALAFTEITQNNWILFERMFLRFPELNPFYREMIPETKNITDQEILGVHLASIVFQIIEDVYQVEDLGVTKDDEGMAGWMYAFTRWLGSPTLQKWWPIMRRNYGTGFISFVEREFLNEKTRAERLSNNQTALSEEVIKLESSFKTILQN